MQNSTRWGQFFTITAVFFFWGFVAASNDILIPVFKDTLNLEQWQSQMVSFAFYVAYTVGSVLYILGSRWAGGDLLKKLGYKNGVAVGLIISAIGTALFYPAAEIDSFYLMITGLFIVGLGFSLQQTAANTLVVVIGDPKKGAQRLSLAGGVNNFGTTIGPLIVNYAIFGSVVTGATASTADTSAVKTPYLILGLAFLVVALLFRVSSIPNKFDDPNDVAEELDSSSKSDSSIKDVQGLSTAAGVPKKTSAIQFTQLWMGMIGIFVYVGVEVSTASNLPEFMKSHLLTPTDQIAPYVSLFWASLMIGRWTAAVGAFDLSKGTRQILGFVMPYIAFGVFLFVTSLANHTVDHFYIYGLVILLMIGADLLSKGNPARQLLIFSTMAIIALFVGMLSDGMVSVFAFISVGLFCSTLWPCIFTLAIAGLGKFTNQGSSYLIMMIMGGGVISLLQGFLADHGLGIQWSYLVGVACFAYLAFYAWKVKKVLAAQGIDYDQVNASGGGH
jgi:FHS family L-fucose permease-like MFS transporter